MTRSSVSYETETGGLPPPPTPEQYRAYQDMYDYFNRALFGGQLRPVLLNFSRQAGAIGFFASDRWEDAAGKKTHEISLNPTALRRLPPVEVASTLVHEMCHLWQCEHGSPSRPGYHNWEWARKMESIGLIPSNTGEPGGAKVGQKMADYPAKDGPFARAFAAMPAACRLPWQGVLEPEAQRPLAGPAGPRSKVKYTCPGCRKNLWGKPGLSIRCGNCDAPLADETAMPAPASSPEGAVPAAPAGDPEQDLTPEGAGEPADPDAAQTNLEWLDCAYHALSAVRKDPDVQVQRLLGTALREVFEARRLLRRRQGME